MIIPVGYGQATFRFTGSALPYGAVSTLGFQNVLGGTAQQCADAIAGIALGSDIMNNVSQEVTLVDVLVKLGPDATGPSAVAVINDVGDDTDPGAAPNTSWLIRKSTAAGGRAGRGRMFWPGVPQSVVTAAGTIAPGTIIVFQPKWTDFLADLDTGNVPAMLLHSGPGLPTEITSLTIDTRAATQRRRLRR